MDRMSALLPLTSDGLRPAISCMIYHHTIQKLDQTSLIDARSRKPFDNMTINTQVDRHRELRGLPCLRGASVVSQLCAVQKLAHSAEKAHEWAEHLICLQYKPSTSGGHFRKVYKDVPQDSFVAISWTRQPSKWENPESGNIRFCLHVEVGIIWFWTRWRFSTYEIAFWTEC